MTDKTDRIHWISQTPPSPPSGPPGEEGRLPGPEPEEPAQRTDLIDQIGRNLTRLARAGRLKPLFGRKKELLRLQRILLRKEKNNPLVVGAAGVGKTALVEGLAGLIAADEVNPALRGARIVEISTATLMAGTSYRGAFEDKLLHLLQEARQDPSLLLFFDEIHTLMGAGAAGRGGLDAANIIKPALARGELHCLGATSPDEYDRFIGSDAAFTRRFEPLLLEEPTEAEAVELVIASVPAYEKHHRVQILPEAVEAAVRLSSRHMPDRRLPDKAFDLLDDACTLVRLPDSAPVAGAAPRPVDGRMVSQATAARLNIPIDKLDLDLRARLAGLGAALQSRIAGQAEALGRVEAAVRGAFLGLGKTNRPRAVMAFFGSSGVGKTETAKALAGYLFQSPDAAIRLDLSEYKEAYTVSRLLGPPPGYVGYEDEGTFATRLRRQPFAVVLLDEFDKAHPQVLETFLHIFDEGRFSDSRGRLVDARQALFVLTSTLFSISSESPAAEYDQNCETVRRSLCDYIRPELVNRIGEIVLFRDLDTADLERIAGMELDALALRMAEQGFELKVDGGVSSWIARAAGDPEGGARAVLRLISREISQPLSGIILKGGEPRSVHVAVEEHRIVIH